MSMTTTYQTVKVADRRTGSALNVFYREAGLKDTPVVLLDACSGTDGFRRLPHELQACHLPAKATRYIHMQGYPSLH